MSGIVDGVVYTLLFISLYFEVFLLVTFLEKRDKRTDSSTTVPWGVLPSVCIVIPCFNEERALAHTIHSVFTLRYPCELLDIIIVDDGSTDRTLAVAKTFEHRGIRVLHKENGGKHTAMNLALARTNSDFIVCLDADSVVDSEALIHIVSAFKNKDISAVTPGIHVKKPENALQHLQNAEYNLSVFGRFTLAALGSVFITPGLFSIYRTSVVRDLGGWRHGHSTEDMELALRMQENGHKIANAPAAAVYTTTPKTLPELFHQRVRWMYGLLRNFADYKFMFGNRAYGNLGLFILPTALISIGAGMYFFIRVLWYGLKNIYDVIARMEITGIAPHPSFDLFYFNTSALLIISVVTILLVLTLISAGAWIGTGRRMPPSGTPFFILLYGLLVPLWISTAIFRALFKTGVRWR
jgi:cellulose synthase/poly-beta-1,6-N-acetylglucosamine synthase-like glycosyltransferase